MKYGLQLALFTALALVLWGTAASADPCVDVELAFDPTSASPGEEVHIFASVENTGDMPGEVTLAVTIDVNGNVIGPIVGSRTLAAGEEVSVETVFIVPSVTEETTLTITVEASAGGCTDVASASLTVEPGTGAPASGAFNALAQEILVGLGVAIPTDTEEITWGALKIRFRK